MHKQRQPRDAAARRLQRVFRGWRTRRRVVHQVRTDMELLVEDIRRQLDGEWALLGPHAAMMSPFSLDWGDDDKLRLPRMEDSIFGVPVHSSEIEHLDEGNEGAANADEQVAVEQEATNDPSTVDNAQVDSNFENGPVGEAVGAQASQGTNEEIAISSSSSDTSTRDARASAVEIRGTVLQAETTDSMKRQAENMDGALQSGKDGSPQLTTSSVQEILATHSRAEILLELEWARQALRDRREYLRSKRRVERGPDPCACA